MPDPAVSSARGAVLVRLTWIGLLVGLGLFLWILLRLDYRQMGHILAHANPWWILLGTALGVPEVWLRARKLAQLTSSHVPLKIKDAMITYLVGLPFGFVSPGRVGDLARIFTLRKRTGLVTSHCLAIALIDRLIDLFVLLMAAALGIAVVINFHVFGTWDRRRYLVLTLAAIGLIMGVMILILRRGMAVRCLALARRILPGLEPLWHRAEKLLDTFYLGLETVLRERLIIFNSLVLSASTIVLVAARSWLFALGLGQHTPLLFFIIFIPVSMAVELLPISLMGFGTREYTYIRLFDYLGVPQEMAVAISLLSFLLGSLSVAVVGYWFALREHLTKRDLQKVLE